jgi:hypothetical protein
MRPGLVPGLEKKPLFPLKKLDCISQNIKNKTKSHNEYLKRLLSPETQKGIFFSSLFYLEKHNN